MNQTMNCRIMGLIGLLAVSFTATAWSADVKFSGLMFGEYAMNASQKSSAGSANDVQGRHGFDVPRVYINAEAKFTPKWKAKVVLETHSLTAGNAVFLKNAFGDYAFSSYGNLTFGMIGTPWIGNEEGIWGRRFVQKTAMDETGILKSADRGLGLLGKLPKGFGDVHLVYVNGEGYNAVELSTGNGRYKDFAGRVTIAPLAFTEMFAGLKLHGYAQQGRIRSGEASRRDRYIGGASFQNALFHLMYSYTHGQDGDGTGIVGDRKLNRKFDVYSAHGSVVLAKGLSLFGRFEKVRFNKAAGNDDYNRSVWGADYKVAEGVRVALSDQVIRPLRISTKAYENLVKAHVELKF